MRLPESSNVHAAWKPSTALWVAQIRSLGTNPSPIVQAETHVPAMTTGSPESRTCRKCVVYSCILPPTSSSNQARSHVLFLGSIGSILRHVSQIACHQPRRL